MWGGVIGGQRDVCGDLLFLFLFSFSQNNVSYFVIVSVPHTIVLLLLSV